MSPETLMKKFESLSNKEKKEVLDFIDFLRRRKNRLKKSSQNKIVSIEDEKFIGMWKNRADLTDSTTWVRNLRKTDWPD